MTRKRMDDHDFLDSPLNPIVLGCFLGVVFVALAGWLL